MVRSTSSKEGGVLSVGRLAGLGLLLVAVTLAQASPPERAREVSPGTDRRIRLETTDGVEIVGSYRAPRTSRVLRPGVVLLHGGGRSRDEWVHSGMSGALVEEDWHVLAIDLRGHGESSEIEGAPWRRDPTLALADVEAALQWLRRQPGVDRERVGLIGSSYGANLAVAGVRSQDWGVPAIVCLSATAASARFLERHPPRRAIPAGLYLAGDAELERYDAEATARELAKKTAGTKAVEICPGRAHGTGLLFTYPELVGEIRQWLRGRLGREVASRPTLSPRLNASLIAALEDVEGAKRRRYDAKDDHGYGLDCLKVLPHPGGGYLGFYHYRVEGVFVAKLATSTDLVHWKHGVDLDRHASMPTASPLPGGGWLVAYEKDAPGRCWIRLRHYPSVKRLLEARHDREFDAPRSLAPTAEGTPHIVAASSGPDLDRSVIDLGFHYFKDARVDLQASGRLTGFRHWHTRAETRLDAEIRASGAKGAIGDRDAFTLRGRRYTVTEARLVPGDWRSWRVFLHDAEARQPRRLSPKTAGGSRAFSNPTVSRLPGPRGKEVLFVSYFLPREGAAPGEAGQLLFFRELD